MNALRRLRPAAAAVLLWASACGCRARDGSAKPPETVEELFILGRVVAANATVVRAPSNEFRVGGWGGGGGGVKFTELKADGAKVKEGEEIARFKFDWEQALDYFRQRLASEKAASTRSELQLANKERELQSQQKQVRFGVQLAKIDTLKGDAVPKNRLKYFEGTYELRRFEEGAIEKRMAAFERRREGEDEYYKTRVAQAQATIEQYERVKAGFVLKAPHDGVLRHLIHPWNGRKIQKGDNMQGGMEAVSVARDETLAIELFVPERKLKHFRKGGEAYVRDPADNNRRHTVVIKEIEDFPQEIGFLIHDSKVPQAREKAFVVKAAFKKQPAKLSVGGEVKGEIP